MRKELIKKIERKKSPKLDLSDIEVAWIAGLLEGEGTFTPNRQSRKLKKHPGWKSTCIQPRVQIQSQDKDVIRKFAILVGSNMLGPYSQKRSSRPGFSKDEYKECYVVSFSGKKAASLSLMIYPHMGGRRKRQISLGVKEWGQWHEEIVEAA